MALQQKQQRRYIQQKLEFPPLPPELADKYKKGQMYKFDDKLMKLPVPPLQQTLEKYITSVEVRVNRQSVYIGRSVCNCLVHIL